MLVSRGANTRLETGLTGAVWFLMISSKDSSAGTSSYCGLDGLAASKSDIAGVAASIGSGEVRRRVDRAQSLPDSAVPRDMTSETMRSLLVGHKELYTGPLKRFGCRRGSRERKAQSGQSVTFRDYNFPLLGRVSYLSSRPLRLRTVYPGSMATRTDSRSLLSGTPQNRGTLETGWCDPCVPKKGRRAEWRTSPSPTVAASRSGRRCQTWRNQRETAANAVMRA